MICFRFLRNGNIIKFFKISRNKPWFQFIYHVNCRTCTDYPQLCIMGQLLDNQGETLAVIISTTALKSKMALLSFRLFKYAVQTGKKNIFIAFQ